MSNIDVSSAQIDQVMTHQIGNKAHEEGIALSDDFSLVATDTKAVLNQYLLSSFKVEELHQFDHPENLDANELYFLCKTIFQDISQLKTSARQMAHLLYDCSDHPNIKAGLLTVVYFSKIHWQDEELDAIGIFKSESELSFLKMEAVSERYAIKQERGYDLKGLDKGCLVFNTNEPSGYHVLVKDHVNQNQEAIYWKERFLQLLPIQNDFYATHAFLDMTKNFLTEKAVEEFDLQKMDQLELMDKSVSYFKKNQQFNQEEFAAEVFSAPEIIDSFKKYDQECNQFSEVNWSEQFDISDPAVKKQSKIFKSILKLDKNFSVYIHGDRNLIEQGEEMDGRRYYKLYYNEEK